LQVEHGNGLVHALLCQRSMADDAVAFVGSARKVGVTADRALRRIDRILSEADLSKALLEIQRAAGELADVTSAIKSGKGLAPTLIMTKTRVT
jgi:uncharacterized membrane protein